MNAICKAATTITLLLAAFNTFAQQPDWIALSLVTEQAFDESSPQPSKRIYLYQRCAGQQLAMSTVVAEASAELEQAFTESAMYLNQAAVLNRASLAQERTGQAPDIANLSKSSLEAVSQLYDQYMTWLNNNYLLSGEYFANDEDFQNEMELCTMVPQIARSAITALSEDEK
jgi:hypothetical protein